MRWSFPLDGNLPKYSEGVQNDRISLYEEYLLIIHVGETNRVECFPEQNHCSFQSLLLIHPKKFFVSSATGFPSSGNDKAAGFDSFFRLVLTIRKKSRRISGYPKNNLICGGK